MKRFMKIGSFQEYLKKQKQKKITESNVSIEVDWWDTCIVEVLQELEDECNGLFDWTTLGNFIKAKFSILGRTWDEYIDNIYILHIKDLIFQYHGKSFCLDYTSNDNATLHTKGVVIEQLAQVIYDKIAAKLNNGTDPDLSTVNLIDKEPATMVPMKTAPIPDDDGYDISDDLPFEKMSYVRGYENFKNILKEAVYKIKYNNYQGCLDYCLNTIKSQAGSLMIDDIMDFLMDEDDMKAQKTILTDYLHNLVKNYMSKDNKVLLNGDFDEEKKKDMDDVMNQAEEAFADMIIDDILMKLVEEKEAGDEKVK